MMLGEPCCCNPPVCGTVFYSNNTYDRPPPADCPGGPYYNDDGSGADLHDLNPLWWTLVEGGPVDPYLTDSCASGISGLALRIFGTGSGATPTIITNTQPVKQPAAFKIHVEFYPRTNGDLLWIILDYIDIHNYKLIEFECIDHLPAVGVYNVVGGTRTKLRRKANSCGGSGQGFYFNLSIVPCPQIIIDISLCRNTLLVQIGGTGSQPAETPTSPIDVSGNPYNYNYDWSGMHVNYESPDNVIGPGALGSPFDQIGYRPLVLSCGPDTSGSYSISSQTWGIGGFAAGDYFDIGVVFVDTTSLNTADIGPICDTNACKPLTVCNGLLTEYPIHISMESKDVLCGPHARTWCNRDAPGTETFTDCDTTLGEPYELCTEYFCHNFNTTFTADWVPCLGNVGHTCTFGSGTPDFCSYFTGHTDVVDSNNPAQGATYVCCDGGSAETLVAGHEGVIRLTGITAGFGFEGGTNGAAHVLDQAPGGTDFPEYWLPGDVVGKWFHNHGGPAPYPPTAACVWADYDGGGFPIHDAGQQVRIAGFSYEASD